MGFAGGEWRGGHFAYNTAVMNVNRTYVHTTYVNETIVHNTTIINNTHVAYAGGPGGIQHQPTAEENVAMHEQHREPTAAQTQHFNAAQSDPGSRFSANHGRPTTVAVARPLTAPPSRTNAPAMQSNRPAVANNPSALQNGSHAGTPANTQYGSHPANMGTTHPTSQPAYQSTPAGSHTTSQPAYQPMHSTPPPQCSTRS